MIQANALVMKYLCL